MEKSTKGEYWEYWQAKNRGIKKNKTKVKRVNKRQEKVTPRDT